MKLKYDKLLSSFAFNFNLRRYTTVKTHFLPDRDREISERDELPLHAAALGLAAASAGPNIFSMDSDAALAADLLRVDVVTAPAALLVLCAVVGRCRLTVSNPVLKAPMVSALDTII